jgi:hypothetical protein
VQEQFIRDERELVPHVLLQFGNKLSPTRASGTLHLYLRRESEESDGALSKTVLISVRSYRFLADHELPAQSCKLSPLVQIANECSYQLRHSLINPIDDTEPISHDF